MQKQQKMQQHQQQCQRQRGKTDSIRIGRLSSAEASGALNQTLFHVASYSPVFHWQIFCSAMGHLVGFVWGRPHIEICVPLAGLVSTIIEGLLTLTLHPCRLRVFSPLLAHHLGHPFLE